MYTYEWSPTEIDSEGEKTISPLFGGKVKLKAVSNIERFQYMKQAGIKLNESGEAEIAMEETYSRIEALINIAKKHIIDVDLVRLEDEYPFKSIEDLEYDTDGGNLLLQIANVVIGGTKLGKHLSKSSNVK